MPLTPVTPGTVTLVKNSKQPAKANAVVYQIAGLRGTIRFVKTLFAGEAPEVLTVDGATFATPTAPKVKLTPEERKAARAAMTPAQKIEAERKRNANAQAKLAKMEAAL